MKPRIPHSIVMDSIPFPKRGTTDRPTARDREATRPMLQPHVRAEQQSRRSYAAVVSRRSVIVSWRRHRQVAASEVTLAFLLARPPPHHDAMHALQRRVVRRDDDDTDDCMTCRASSSWRWRGARRHTVWSPTDLHAKM